MTLFSIANSGTGTHMGTGAKIILQKGKYMTTGAISFSPSQPTVSRETVSAPPVRPFLSDPMTITVSEPMPVAQTPPVAQLSFSNEAAAVAVAANSPSTRSSLRRRSTDSLSPHSVRGRHLKRKRSQTSAATTQVVALSSPTLTTHTLQSKATSTEGGGGGGDDTDTDSLGPDTDTDTDTESIKAKSPKAAQIPAESIRQTLLTITPKQLGKVIEYLRGDDVKNFLQFNKKIRETAAKITFVNFSNSPLIPKKSRALIVDSSAPWYSCFFSICGAPEIKTFGCRDVVRYFPGATTVILSHTELTSASIPYLPRLRALSLLDLSSSKELKPQDFRELKKVTSLTTLILRGCESITTDSIDEICQLASLKRLNVSGCKRIDKFGFRNVKQLTNLTSLDVSECPLLTNFTISNISEIQKLRHFSLNKCTLLTDRAFVNLARFETLKTLESTHLPLVTSTALRYLQPLSTRLLYLNISFCDRMDETAIDAINSFIKLRILKMDNCRQMTAAMIDKLRLPIIMELHIRNIKNVTPRFVRRWLVFRPKTKVFHRD